MDKEGRRRITRFIGNSRYNKTDQIAIAMAQKELLEVVYTTIVFIINHNEGSVDTNRRGRGGRRWNIQCVSVDVHLWQ